MGSFVAKLFLLIGAIIWSIMTYIYFIGAPLTKFDVTVNAISTLVFWGCFVGCLINSYRLFIYLKISLACTAVAILSPAWYYSYLAYNIPDASFFDIMPPISGVVAPLVVGCYLFLKKRHAIYSALGIWLFFNTPVLAYSITDPNSLFTPRGLDYFLSATLIPVAMMALMLVYSHLNQRVNNLEIEKGFLKQQSELDELTQAFNRRYAYNLIQLLEAGYTDTSCIFLDIDHFKQINDQFGHEAGDDILFQLTQRCKSVLRNQDHFIRWGGEEFLILCEDTSLKNAQIIAQKLKNALSLKPIGEVNITASFGISFAKDGQDIKGAIKRADMALYQAKSAGRNCVELS